MRPISFTRSQPTADPNGTAESQTVTGASALVLNGVLVVSGVSTHSVSAYVTITSAGNDSGITFTITGTRPGGSAQTEVVTGANAGTATSTLAFDTVTSIVTSGSTASTVEAGTAQAGYTDWIPLDIYTPNQVTTISCNVNGTVNYSVQYTNEDPFNREITQMVVSHPVAALVGATADQTGFTTTLMRAVRLVINSGSGSVLFTCVQQSTA